MFLIALLITFLLATQASAARINLFLNIENPTKQEISFQIKDIRIKLPNKELEIKDFPKEISSKSSFNQAFLGHTENNLKNIEAINIDLKSAFLNTKEIPVEKKSINLPINVKLNGDESICIFVIWDVKSSLRKGNFYPSFFVKAQRLTFRRESLYVTCEDADTLFVIRTDLNQVIASIRVSGYPLDLAADDKNNRLIVVSQKNRRLNIIELSTLRLVDSIVLPFVISPQFIALLPGNNVIVTDPDSDYVLVEDIDTGNVISARRVGYSPSEVVFDPVRKKIFVSSPSDQSIYVFEPSLLPVSKIKIGQSPRGLYVFEDILYVADPATGYVHLISLGNYAPKGQFFSGSGAVQVFAQNGRVYISNEYEGSISITSPGQMSVAKKISIGRYPYDLASSNRRGWLYVGLRKEKSIAVIDLSSERLKGKIRLGCRPFGLAVAQ
ncbi:YncE family protein [Thermodesulfatator atlanticus]|uniref:YncE family protein n=1 Tax=Thermodesulfatator atlanticus TaxID=501497 RepID=UPI0003B428D6|nr:YncE family protein [Thermodesulfatator atlanticus]